MQNEFILRFVAGRPTHLTIEHFILTARLNSARNME